MTTTMTSKGQVTIPKRIRDSLGLKPGARIAFSVNQDGDVVLQRPEGVPTRKTNRFEAARGKADVKWGTQQLMDLLRSEV